MAGTLDSRVDWLERLQVPRAGAADPPWLSPLRKAAASRFAETGFPTRRDEDWRFTNIQPIVGTAFAGPVGEPSALASAWAEQNPIDELTAVQLVFVNGRYEPALSRSAPLPEGVLVGSLLDVLRTRPQDVEAYLGRYAPFEHNAFAALNTALFTDGAVVVIPPGVTLERPITVVYLGAPENEPFAAHPRTLLAAGENSQAALVERYESAGDGVCLTNPVTEVVLGENAIVDHVRIQRESLQAYHISTTQVELARNSVFTSHSIGLGGAIVRNDVNAHFGGEGGEATLNGLYVANGTQFVDNHTAIDHAAPHCASHELYKHVLGGSARGVFNGKILVRLDAQKTDAKQTNKTLLLSRDAQMHTKPQLEIFADDVRCTHGATIGQLDAEALFYLRSRGIGAVEAERLLIYAFASDIVGRISVESIRRQLDDALLVSLPRR